VILIAIVIPWTAKTVMRNAEWRDNLRLFESARHAAPRSAKVRTQLGDSYFAVSDYTSAVAAYRAALRIYPDYAGAAINLGSAYDALGRYDETLDLLGSFAGRSGPFETARLRELARALIGKRRCCAPRRGTRSRTVTSGRSTWNISGAPKRASATCGGRSSWRRISRARRRCGRRWGSDAVSDTKPFRFGRS
jgi:tetratricopeptide (TPR) repeat protein